MAADTYSALLGLLEQATGNNNNSWGANLNTGALDKVDLAIAGRAAYPVTGGTLDLSGTPPPAGPSGAIHAFLEFSGTLASDQIIQVPNLSKIWFVLNLCTQGAFTLKFKTPSGSASSAIPPGVSFIACDGSNGIRGGNLLGNDGTLANPAISSLSEQKSGIRRKAANDWTFVINSLDVMEWLATGVNVIGALDATTFTQAGTPIRLPGEEIDYAGLTEPTGWYFTAGQAKNRVTDATLFAVIAPNTVNGVAITGNTHTNTTLDNLTVDMRNMGLVGAFIEGTGIPSGTTIVSIAATSLVLSAAATGTASGIAIRVLPYGQGDASTTFTLPDRRGTFTATRDDMNGAARGLLTKNTTQGIDGTKLNVTGGEQAHTLTQLESANWAVSGNGTTLVGAPRYTRTDATSGGNCLTGSGTPVNAITQIASVDTDITNFRVDIVPFFLGGGGLGHNNIPPGSICNRLIKR